MKQLNRKSKQDKKEMEEKGWKWERQAKEGLEGAQT